jgi:hypothetical protein
MDLLSHGRGRWFDPSIAHFGMKVILQVGFEVRVKVGWQQAQNGLGKRISNPSEPR